VYAGESGGTTALGRWRCLVKKTMIVLFSIFVVMTGSMGACGFGSSPATPPGPTPTPFPLQISGQQGITLHTLCVIVEQVYPEIDDKSPEPIAEDVGGLLAMLGVQSVDEGEACEATLSISLTGKADKALFSPGPEWCYNGAKMDGQLVLISPGHDPVPVALHGECPIPNVINRCIEYPENAPFSAAWLEALLHGLARLWGTQVFINGLTYEDAGIQEFAAEALIEIGPEEGVIPALIEVLGHERSDSRRQARRVLEQFGLEAVPALIEALQEDDENVRENAGQALERITDEDFGQDASAWQQWWLNQQ
jgi:hypothetical protein